MVRWDDEPKPRPSRRADIEGLQAQAADIRSRIAALRARIRAEGEATMQKN
jgi:hypothetical protein